MNEEHQMNLWDAVKAGDLATTKQCIEYKMTEPLTYDKGHRSLLHYGVLSHNLSLVKYLTNQVGLSPLDADIDCITPFDLSFTEGTGEILEFFESRLGFSYEETFHNPIRPGFYPDPSIIAVGKDYYMVNSSFTYFPAIPISHSTDLLHWETIGHAITNPHYLDLSHLEEGRGIWAPDISYCDGTFYITATLRGNDNDSLVRTQLVVSSKTPQGPYSEPSYILEDGIDPSLFHAPDGKHYMLLNRGARILPLSNDCKKKTGPAKLLYYGISKKTTEGPHLLYKDGYYYLFVAEGGTGDNHQVNVARSVSLDKPFENCPWSPLLTQRDLTAPLQRTGHGKPFQAHDGNWYFPYLCSRKRGGNYSILGRETSLAKLTWTKDGWPLINDGQGPLVQMKVPFPNTLVDQKIPKNELDFLEYNGMKLTRQTSLDCFITLSLSESDDNVGLIWYYDQNSYVRFGVHKERDYKELVIVERNANESVKPELQWRALLQDRPVTLRIKSHNLDKTFGYGDSPDLIKDVALIREATYLTDEGIKKGKRFEGPMCGTYSTDVATTAPDFLYEE